MPIFRLLHIADVHLGARTYRKLSPGTLEDLRLRDFERALNEILDSAISRDIDIALFAGDTFSTPYPSPDLQNIVYSAIKKLLGNGVKSVFLLGNHELPGATRKAHTFLPLKSLELPGVKVADSIESFTLKTKNGSLDFISLPYPTKSWIFRKYPRLTNTPVERLLSFGYKLFLAEVAKLLRTYRGENPLIFLAHIFVSDAIVSGWNREYISGEEFYFPRDAINRFPFTYAALGHIHRFQDLNQGKPFPMVYSGSLERITFSEQDERKGGVIVELYREESAWKARYEFIRVHPRNFITIEADLRDEKEPVSKLAHLIASHNIKDAIVRVNIRLRRAEGKAVDMRELSRLMSPAFDWRTQIFYDEPLRQPESPGFDWGNPISAIARYIDTCPELKLEKNNLLELVRELYREIEGQT